MTDKQSIPQKVLGSAPKVREFYDNLRKLNQETEQQVWLRTSHHTSPPPEQTK